MIDVREDHLKIVLDILNKFVPSCEVRVFDSRYKWTAKDYSDLDLAIVGKEKIDWKLLADIKEAFQESELPYRVDVLDWNRISEEFKKVIETSGYEVVKKSSGGKVKTEKLSDLFEIIGGGTPKTSTPEYWDGQIPWLSVTDFRGDLKKVYSTEKKISEKGLKESSTKILKSGSLIISARGTVGEIAMLGKDMAFNQSCYGLITKSEFSNNFLYYLLKHNINSLKQNTHGSVFDTITKETFEKLTAEVPVNTYIAEKIANILSSLDDKIELNQKMNETLESMAKAIFKEWFIDFGPVKAKAEGRKPFGMDDETAALFPDSFEESELGLIPKGWRVQSLSEISNYISRGISPAYVSEGGIIVYNQKCVRNGIVTFHSARKHNSEKKINYEKFLLPLDILINSTGMGTLGRVGQIFEIEEPSIVDSHITIVRANSSKISPFLLGVNLRIREAEIESLGEGSTGQTELSRHKLSKLLIVVPPKSIQDQIEKILNSLMTKLSINIRENIYLKSFLDLLLPKLISGEIQLKKVDFD